MATFGTTASSQAPPQKNHRGGVNVSNVQFVQFIQFVQFVHVQRLPGAKTQKSGMVTMVTLLFGNKSAMVKPMVRLWSLWSGGAFVQF